jgi:hypothetical protein
MNVTCEIHSSIGNVGSYRKRIFSLAVVRALSICILSGNTCSQDLFAAICLNLNGVCGHTHTWALLRFQSIHTGC